MITGSGYHGDFALGATVNIKFNSWDAFLQNHFDMGQKQAKKVLGD